MRTNFTEIIVDHVFVVEGEAAPFVHTRDVLGESIGSGDREIELVLHGEFEHAKTRKLIERKTDSKQSNLSDFEMCCTMYVTSWRRRPTWLPSALRLPG